MHGTFIEVARNRFKPTVNVPLKTLIIRLQLHHLV